MPKIVIADTSTLILFQKIDGLGLLGKVYGKVTITPEVAHEFGDDLPNWIEIDSAKDKKYQSFLETQVDKGEASALALACELEDVLLILDDLKARKLAIQMKFQVTGTLGIIYKAKQLSIIPKVKPYIQMLLDTNFRISDEIVREFLKLNDEE